MVVKPVIMIKLSSFISFNVFIFFFRFFIIRLTSGISTQNANKKCYALPFFSFPTAIPYHFFHFSLLLKLRRSFLCLMSFFQGAWFWYRNMAFVGPPKNCTLYSFKWKSGNPDMNLPWWWLMRKVQFGHHTFFLDIDIFQVNEIPYGERATWRCHF